MTDKTFDSDAVKGRELEACRWFDFDRETRLYGA
jgi:hypothetical protein